MAMTAREMVNSVGMSEHVEVYANRVATWTDLSVSHVLGIYNRIRNEIGAHAVEAFVSMVENLKILTASNFLSAFYALEENGWVYAPFEENDPGVGPGDTEYIRNTFLARIGKIPYPKNELTEHTYHSF